MADNLELNAGTGGSVLSTDEVTRSTVVQHVQYVKLMNGTDAAIDVIPGEATNGLDVDVTRVQGTVTVDGSGVTQPVSAASLPLPAGAATSANQTTVIGHLDGVEGLLTTIDADTSIVSALSKAADAVAGGTDTGIPILAIRDDALTTLTPVDGDYAPLRVSSTGALHVTGGGGGTEYTVDTALGATPTGTVPLAVRDDALSALTPVEGDAIALRVGSTGALWTAVSGTVTVDGSGVTQPVSNAGLTELAAAINASSQVDVNIAASSATLTVASHAVTNAGTFAVQESGAALTALQLIDDAIVVDDAAFTPATTKVMMAGFEFDDAAPDSVNEGDAGAARMSANRNIYTTIRDAAGNERGLNVAADGSIAITVATIPSHAVTNAGTFATQVSSIAAGDNNIGNVDVVTLPNVTLAAGTNTNEVVGDVAHDAAASGNPVGISGVAQTMDDTAPPNRVSAEGDATRLATSLDGSIFAHPHGPQIWSYHVNGSSALTDTTVHASPGAGLSLYVTDIVISSGAATAMNAFFEEGATTVLGPYYLEAVAGRGCAIHFGTPKKITAATALTVTTSAAIAHSIDVTGYVAPA